MNKTNITLTSVIILFLSLGINANASIPLSGKIIERGAEIPVEFANIVLLTLPDSTFIAGTISNVEGVFKFENLDKGRYIVKISYVGLESKNVPVEINTNQIDLGEIYLDESNVLAEVVVTSKIPPFQSGVNGGVVANVSTTLLSSVGTASDVLQRMPGVLSENGKLSVFGKGAPVIYINNRKVQDSSELERLESSEISTVELITNPGAKYDAEGRAVLLIKTRSRTNGFSAQVTERLRLGKYLGDTENVSIGYTINGLNVFATYYHNYTKRETTEDHIFILSNEEGVWSHATSLPDNIENGNSHQVSTGFDYSINDMHAFGGQYQYYTSDYGYDMPIRTKTDLDNVLYETSQTESKTDINNSRHLMNAFYNGEFSDRFSLRLDLDYMKNYEESKQNSNEVINSEETRTVDIFNETDYDLYAAKLTNGWKSDFGLIEFGIEYNYITGDGYVKSNGSTDNTEFANIEQKAAGFASYSHKLGKANVSAGLRYEFTEEISTEGVEKTKIIDRTYSDLYPNVTVSGMLGDANLSLAFNKRTQRPSFSQLNGNVVYLNRFVFQKGDPYLRKSNMYDLNLQATLKSFYFNLGYVHTKDPILLFLKEQDNSTNSILATYSNFPKYQELYATLNWNTKISFWQPNYSVNIIKPYFEAEYEGDIMKYNKLSYSLRAYNDFTLPLGWVVSCNYIYWSNRNNANFETLGYQRLDLGLRKSFFDNTLRMNLMVYDIFNSQRLDNRMRINNLDWSADKKFESRYATLSITYLFNNYRKKYRGASAAQDDLDRF